MLSASKSCGDLSGDNAAASVSNSTPSAALLGLVGAVVGGLALARSVRRIGNGASRGAVVALGSGLIAVVGGGLNLAVADGGPGTGNGVVGGALALMLGLVAAVLGGLAVARSRRTDARTIARARQ